MFAAGLTVVAAAAGSIGERGNTVEFELRSRALASPLRFAVYLPPGYLGSDLHYPVVYFLHGLPASSWAFRNAVPQDALRQLGRHVLVVVPQGAHVGDPDGEYLDWGRGRNWESAISKELPGYVDRHFRTIASRRGRGIVGISAGGYGALAIGLHHLDTFSVVESWSGYGVPTNPAGTARLDLGSTKANRRASVHVLAPGLATRFRKQPTFLGFYVGSADTRFRDENLRLHDELTRAGVPHLFAIYPGGHGSALWAGHARHWLGLAIDHLARASSAS